MPWTARNRHGLSRTTVDDERAKFLFSVRNNLILLIFVPKRWSCRSSMEGSMRIRAITITALALAASIILSNPTWAQSSAAPAGRLEPIGKIQSVTGSVTVERAIPIVTASIPGKAPQAREGDLVYRGDVIATTADAKVSLTFADGTAFNVSGNARMVLDEFVYNPDSKSNSSLFSLIRGTFTFVAGKVAKTGSMKVDTPVGTMGIRGTTPHVVISEDGSVKFTTLVEEKK